MEVIHMNDEHNYCTRDMLKKLQFNYHLVNSNHQVNIKFTFQELLRFIKAISCLQD